MPYIEEAKKLIGETLQIQDRVDSFKADTLLLGHVPELDSMAVVSIITTMEEHFGFIVEDDEISADTFESIGSLAEFINQKLSA